jgi:hypothetical protein
VAASGLLAAREARHRAVAGAAGIVLPRLGSARSGYRVGAFLGALLVSFLFAWIVRSLFRLARRRPVNDPMWTPGLFLGAAIFSLLSAFGQAGNDA